MRKRIKPLAILIFFASFIAFILISKQITDSQEKQAQAKISQTKQTPSSSKKEETSDDSSLMKSLFPDQSLTFLAGSCQVRLITTYSRRMFQE